MATASEDSGYVDNWQTGKTVIECNLHMLKSEDCSDVIFRVGSEKHVVRAHRYVLVSRSCVFHAMFCGPLAEKGEVTIPDIDPTVFREFLRYLYSDIVDITAENVTGLLYTSRKYAVDGLLGRCTSFLEKSLSEENVCQILEACHGYGESDLEQKALKILTEAGDNVIKSPGFLDLCDSCLSRFLKSENLNLAEEEIFEAALAWSKEKCRKENVVSSPENLRKYLRDMIYEIRFLAFPSEYLTKVVGPTGVLTNDERIRFMDRDYDSDIDIAPFKPYLRTNNKENTDDKNNFTFHVVNRFEKLFGHWMCGSREDVSFSVDTNISLVGCQLPGPSSGNDTWYKLNVQMYDDKNQMITEPIPNTNLQLNGQQNLHHVMFSVPFSVQAGRIYTICVTMQGDPTFRGIGGQKSVKNAGVVFTFQNSTKPDKGATTVERGQIPGLIWR